MTFQHSDLLIVRERYFDRLIGQFKSYDPNAKRMIRGYLPQIHVLDPNLNEVIALLDDKVIASYRANEPGKQQKYELFEVVVDRVIAHICFKKENTKVEKLKNFDIWTSLFSCAKNKEEAQALLDISDQWEDFICLVNLSLEYGFQEDESHLMARIDDLLGQLPSCCQQLVRGSELEAKLRSLLQSIRELISTNKTDEAKEKNLELKNLIHRTEEVAKKV